MTLIRLVLARLETGALLSAVAVASIFALWTSNFLSLESITSILIVTSESAILAIAVTLLMIAGGFDLSVGSVLGLSSVAVPLMLVNYQVPPLAAVTLAFAIAIGIGLLHGTIVRRLRIPSFIVTLGGLLFWRGIIFVITQGFPVRIPRGNGSFFDFFSYRFPNGFDVSLLWLIAWARERGTSVIFISHNIAHVFEVADRFVVLSHGQTVANLSRVETDENQVSHLVREGRAVER